MSYPLDTPFILNDHWVVVSKIMHKGKLISFGTYVPKDHKEDIMERHHFGIAHINGIEPELISMNKKIVADTTGYFTEEEKQHAAKKLEWFKSLNN